MEEKNLLERCRTALRITSKVYDDQIELLIASALFEFDRLEIPYDADKLIPPHQMAVVSYVRAHFGNHDLKDKQEAIEIYEKYMRKLMVSKNTIAKKVMGDR